MRKLIPLSFGAMVLTANASDPKPTKSAIKNISTWVGTAPCKGCKNCKYCKRCAKDGKTCGICKKLPPQTLLRINWAC